MIPRAIPAAKPVDLLQSLPPGARILLVRLRSLGDTLLSTPLYTALKSWRQDLRLSVLVESPNDEILRNNPDLDNIISIRASDKNALGVFAARYGALKQIRAAKFDCCINLHGGVTSAWLTALSGANHRVGVSTFRNRIAYNFIIDVPRRQPADRKPHTVEYQISWLNYLGLPRGPIPPLRLVPDPSRRASALAKLQDAGLDTGRDYAVIHPGSRYHTKEWPAEGFAEIADEITVKYGLQVLLLGGPGEEEKIGRVVKLCGSPPVVVQNVSVADMVWVIREAKLFVGNDSGPTHIAAALQVPIVVLFGSSDSQVWFPWKSPYQIVQNDFACNPCPGQRCLVYDKPRCILSISPEQVKTAVAAQLRLSTRPR
jgi:predicted lipopolysaccharide heptosyltransferase III